MNHSIDEPDCNPDGDRDIYWMQQALLLAQQARDAGEVPVGAIIVKNNDVVGRGCNQPIALCDPSAHAEIQALREAGRHLSNYRLPGCTLYVTIEPCAMCAGAMVHARIERLVYGAPEPKAGAVASRLSLFDCEGLNHRVRYRGGVMADSCGVLISEFFRRKRR